MLIIYRDGALGELTENCWEDQRNSPSNYIRIKTMCEATSHILGFIFMIFTFNGLFAIITLTYTVFNASRLPVLITIGVILADVSMYVTGRFNLSLATGLNLMSRELIRVARNRYRRVSPYHFKFWCSMRPVTISLGPFCCFETKEFLLFIWGHVVIKTIIDLLLTYEV